MVARILKWFFLPVLFFVLYSCKKNNSAVDSSFIGTWTWLQTTEGNIILVDRSSGIEKKIVFAANGTFSITHNDSTGNYATLSAYRPYVLLPNPVTNMSTYKFVTQPAIPCDPDKIPFLVIQDVGSYQYDIAGDTLRISGSPCLAPVISTYVKN